MNKVIVVGGGPAGLMAAEVLSAAGVQVHVFDAMPSVGRKFLLAGKGGLNLTHSEPADIFASRFGARRAQIEALLCDFDGPQVREWAQGLGVDTFIGSSGRVFPLDMKAAPLLRAWLFRLRHPAGGPSVQFHMRHRWTGWSDDGTSLSFDTPQGPVQHQADAVVLALGGGSWARLGSNGAWVPWLQARGVAVAPLLPANCGFDVAVQHRMPADGQSLPVQVVTEPVPVGWSEHFASRFAGLPVRNAGTLGGNVANGSPIGDAMPLLIALGASVVLMSGRGQRELPLENLYTGYRQNVMAADEVLAWIHVPRPAEGQEFLRLYKISKRYDDDISAVCLGLNLRIDGGIVQSASIGAGGVAATPVRAVNTEAALTGQPWTLDTVQSAIAVLRAEFSPLSDMRASAAYRTEVLGNLLQRYWLESQGQQQINLASFVLEDMA